MDQSNLNIQNQLPQRTLERSDETFAEDRISKLHDSMLCYILSFMSTKSAVRTSILSRRWRNIWKSVPKLQLNSGKFSTRDEFLDFVDRAMAIHSGSCLQKFSLKYHLRHHDESRFIRWFCNLIDCRVQHVEVINCLPDLIPMPGSICNCKTLAVLELDYVRLDVPEVISLPHLKILSFREVEFKDASAFKTFMSGCPVLEEAYITRKGWDNLDTFCLSSQSIKKLCISNVGVHFSDDARVLIDAPNLEYLCLVGQPFHMLTTNASAALAEANIDVLMELSMFHGDLQGSRADVTAAIHRRLEEFRGNIANFSAAISSARSLTFSSETLLVFVSYGFRTPFPNLSYLDAEFFGDMWELLVVFLHNTPNLKTLIVSGASISLGHFRSSDRNQPQRLPPLLANKPECFSTSLQHFELRSVTGRTAEVNLVRYILSGSRFLKKVILHVDRDLHIQRRKLILFLNELRAFRRRGHRPCQISAVPDKSRMRFPEYRKGKFSVWAE